MFKVSASHTIKAVDGLFEMNLSFISYRYGGYEIGIESSKEVQDLQTMKQTLVISMFRIED